MTKEDVALITQTLEEHANHCMELAERLDVEGKPLRSEDKVTIRTVMVTRLMEDFSVNCAIYALTGENHFEEVVSRWIVM